MNKSGCRPRFSALALGAIAQAILLCAVSFSPMASAQNRMRQKASGAYEQTFLVMMIRHHELAVQAATLCEQNAAHDELKQICGTMRSGQQEEISRMQGWLNSWYSQSDATKRTQMRGNSGANLAKLKGDEFDKAFIGMMTVHHASAVSDSAQCLIEATHPELIEQCKTIAQTQAQEIQTMRKWQCDWFSQCRGVPVTP